MEILSFWPIVHLALVVYAAMQIFESSADSTKKIVWIVVVALFPLVGEVRSLSSLHWLP